MRVEQHSAQAILREFIMGEMFSVHLKPRTWLIRATVLAASLGVIHMVATPLYFDQWLGYGVFFFTVAVLQVIHSMVLAASPPSRLWFWVGIVGNTAIVALWIVTRTVGIPFFGPMAGEVLPIGTLDGLAQVLEFTQIVHLSVLLGTFDRLGGRPLVE
jgi:hypothetical protein